MLAKPKDHLTEIMCFSLGVETIEGTYLEKRIDELVKDQ